MKCEKCELEIAYSFSDGVFCSCGFVTGKDIKTKFLEGWKEIVDKIILMRDKYFKSQLK